MNQRLGHLAGILFASVFGLSFMFSKITLKYITPMGLIAYRFLLAFVVFELLRLTKIVKIRFEKKFFIPIFLVTFFQPVLYFIFESFGLTIITSAEAGMMIALIPIFVSILSIIFLNEKPNKIQIGFITLSMLGIMLIQFFKIGSGLKSSIIGFIFLFFAVISAAIFNITSRKASIHLKPYELTYFMMMSGALVFNIIYVVQLSVSNNLQNYFPNMFINEVIFPIIYLGIVASIGGFFLVNFTLSRLPAHVSSIYANLSTVVAVLAGYIVLHEEIMWYHFLGGAMIILGIYGTARANFKNNIVS